MINICSANIAYTLYSINRSKGGKKLTLHDFMFHYDETHSMTDEERNRASFEQILKLKGVKVK